MQQLTLLYNREAAGVDPASTRNAPPALRAQLTDATKRFRETLALHGRILTRMRNASEGLIRAIVTDVEKTRNLSRPYSRSAPTAYARPAGAMIYNSVV